MLTFLKRAQALGPSILFILTTMLTPSALANLPTPPDYEYARDGDWLRVAQAIGDKAIHLLLIFLAVGLLAGVFSGMLRGYQSAQERQEMSHFFKAVGVGIICLALGFGLLYVASLLIK
jgi:hypothetical protein